MCTLTSLYAHTNVLFMWKNGYLMQYKAPNTGKVYSSRGIFFMHTSDCPRCLLIFHPHINESNINKLYINHNEYKRNVIDLKSESGFYVYAVWHGINQVTTIIPSRRMYCKRKKENIEAQNNIQ